MVSFLLWPLAVLGAVFWVMLPAGVLVMAAFYRGGQDLSDPSALQPCGGYDATEPCWVPGGVEYCARHAASTKNAVNS